MTYPETIDYLYRTLPMFQRIGSAAYKDNLDNTWALCSALGNPQDDFKSVHVAGTNGKGSSSHMIASILQSAGYKTGLYTSPHLKEFTERIRINGREVDKEFVVDFVSRIKPVLENIHPSFFETTVGMAFDYFARENVDIAVIEVGLGGRLDSTNVITPLVSLITNIGYDHTDLLGKELPQIAGEKAGIIKPHVPVVISQRQAEVESVFLQRASEQGSSLTFASDHYRLTPALGHSQAAWEVSCDDKVIWTDLESQLKGHYQKYNIPGVLMTIDKLAETGRAVSRSAIRQGIAEVSTRTGLKGRWQKIGEGPLVICDTGHNVDGIREVVKQIRETPHETLHIILGMVKDKNIAPVLDLLPKEARYYFCQAKIPRALAADELSRQAADAGLHGIVVPDVNAALAKARSVSTAGDFIFIGGSTFVVGELDDL